MRSVIRSAEPSSSPLPGPTATDAARADVEGQVTGGEPVAILSPEPGASAAGTAGLHRTRAGTAWVAITAFMVILVLLLIFVLQNSGSVRVHFLGARGTMSLAVAMLFSTIAGALLVALASGVRVLQLRRIARGPTREH